MNPDLKKIAVRLLAFSLPFILVFMLIEWKARQLPTSYLIKEHALQSNMTSLNILILGSSHAFDDLDPSGFSCRGYNLGNSSQSLFYDTRLCLKYIDRMPHLKGVILTISYFSLWYEVEDIPGEPRDYFYHHYFGIDYPRLDRRTLKYYSYAAMYSRDFILDMMLGRLDEQKYFGNIQPGGWNKVSAPAGLNVLSDSVGKARAEDHKRLIRKENLWKNMGYLEELLGEMKKRGIPVVFIIPPAWTSYRKYISTPVMDENRRLLKKLTLNAGCFFYDYFEDPRFNLDDFSDNDHLNATGARKFSDILNKEIVAPLCNGQTQVILPTPSDTHQIQTRPVKEPGR